MKKIGSLLGERYEVLRQLGEGGTGSVYLVRDLKLHGKLRAAKLVHGGGMPLPMWEREAKVLVTLDHPYLPDVIDVWSEGEAGIIIMEYVEGETLEQRLFRLGGSLPVREIARIGKQLSELLVYLHESGPNIMHRDLKPSNVMLDRQGYVRLIDFGIAGRQGGGQLESTAMNATLGRFGTPRFASPEQLAGRPVDARSDLYQLGGLLYYLLSGGHARSGRAGLAFEQSQVPKGLKTILHRLLQPDPELRYRTAGEAWRAFDDLEMQQLAMPSVKPHEGSSTSLVLVGSLYGGAGATFITLALAAAWARRGVECGVVEMPGGRAELFGMLNGEERSPRGYRFLCDRALDQDGLRPAARWRQFGTSWYPLPYERPAAMKADAAQLRRMLELCEEELVLADAGTRWGDTAVKELLPRVSAVVCNVDPFPAKAGSMEAQGHAKELEAYVRHGVPVYWVANRAGAGFIKPWLNTLPARPTAVVPNVPHTAVMQAVWRGSLIQYEKEAGSRLDAALGPLLDVLHPLGTRSGAEGEQVK
ncbi:serine/threonine-protein kinase [Xylanibacillus composti]|uniref:non-specific serine/threonine protein kinase n=1 Tax=Xylanibacillus composti TaxID=1572762 RepID=A0A8J4GZV5_9BACL|nr:serine/threonine-protein kinase [Xylanibacillus composti]GIQ68249.1 protein kinase [Xylanibacillus composti]